MLNPQDNWIVLVRRSGQTQWGALGFMDEASAQRAYDRLAADKECSCVKLAEVRQTTAGSGLIGWLSGRRKRGSTEGHFVGKMPKDCGV